MNDNCWFSFLVPGTPVAKARPRVYQGHAITPPKTEAAEKRVKMAIRDEKQERDQPLAEPVFGKNIPLNVYVSFYFRPPLRTSKKRKEQMLRGEIRPAVRPDADNLAKLVLDAMNGSVYFDDGQIVGLMIAKHYAEEPRTVVSVTKDLNNSRIVDMIGSPRRPEDKIIKKTQKEEGLKK